MTKSPCPSCDSTEYTSIWTLGCDGRCSDCPNEQAETETITKGSSQLLLDAYAKIAELEAENQRLRKMIPVSRLTSEYDSITNTQPYAEDLGLTEGKSDE